MVKFIDRTKMTLTGSAGTGNLTFGSAVAGFQGLAEASVVDGDIVRYTIEDATSYESGTGTIGLSGGTYTMSRSPTSSSLANNGAITVGAAGVVIFTMLAEDVVQYLADIANVDDTTPSHGQALTFVSSSNSWAPVSPSGGITSVANYAALPASPGVTDLAWTLDTKALYIWDGLEWDRIFSGSQIAPRFTTSPASTLELNSDGTTSTLTAVAIDDAGFPITYDWDGFSGTTSYNSSSLPPQLAAVSESSGVFTLTPTTNSSNSGSFQFRIKASDGVLAAAETTTVDLTFQTPVIVDTLQTSGSSTLQATTSGLIQAALSSSNYSTGAGTLNFPTGTGNTMPTGKRYIEAKVTARSGDGMMIGFARYNDAVARNARMAWGSSSYRDSLAYMKQENGYLEPANTAAGYPGGQSYPYVALDVNDILQLAYDTTAEKVWFGINNTWSTATGDPVTGGGRNLDYSAGGYSFVIGSATGGSVASTFQFGGTHTYTTPTGFELY